MELQQSVCGICSVSVDGNAEAVLCECGAHRLVLCNCCAPVLGLLRTVALPPRPSYLNALGCCKWFQTDH